MIIIYENNFFKLSFHLEMPLKNFLVARFFCQTTFLFYLCSLHSYSSSCSLLIRLLSFSIPMNSMEIEPPLVKKGLTVNQNCLLAIILFAFCGLIQEISFCFFGQRIKFIFGSLIKNKISP